MKNYQFQYLIFALPQTNHYQTITKIEFKPPGLKPKIIVEGENKIGFFTFDVDREVAIQFTTSPKTFQTYLNRKLTIQDYNNNLFQPNRFINGTDNQIKKLTKNIVGKEKFLSKIISKLYYFTLDYLTYGKPFEGLYSYQQAMEERTTDCGGFATFLASLLQSVNIPSRLVVGFLIKKNFINQILSTFNFLLMHAWLEVLLPDDSWLPLDPSIEWRRNKSLTKRQGGFGFIPADRLVVSFGCDHRIKVNDKIYQIDILQNPIYL